MCRSRRELSNAYLLGKFGFDTAENEPCKVCPLSAYRSTRYYYVKTRPLCLGFPIKDPGAGGSVGVEKADWMKSCDDAGLATYLGRELVAG